MTVLPALLAAVMTVVAVLSGVRLVAARHGGAALHPRDADVWHGVMGAAMAAMLLVSLTTGVSRGLLALSGLGVVWCLVQMTLRRLPGVYLPLMLCCAAMAVMVVPVALATGAAAASAGNAMTGHNMGHEMTGHSMAGSTLDVPRVLVVALIAAMAAVVVVSVLRLLVARRARRAGEPVARFDGMREIAMAGAMGYMLLAMV